ncbi:MAG: 16S rRNA (cytosine(1402)-N(4))-methyltransferase RsmH [Longimonas sp.]|uniref:16S rRNA (cytosine(1402)-N(4))-methyltransferase RsmH n=1 Tax=Longimonas sp. TaxID=2039626 RepID=UPI00335C966D
MANASPNGSDTPSSAYATAYHAPVMALEVCNSLITDASGTYVDATAGGGGHTEALLDALAPDGQVIAVDQDPEALGAVQSRLAGDVEAGRLHLIRGNFRDLPTLLREAGIDTVSGLLLDLGVSSHQIDEPERGFSFQADGPLDMRMDPERRLTAYAIVNEWPHGDLARVLGRYGEERYAGPIARAIVEARPLNTTGELAEVIRNEVPGHVVTKTLARVFQGLRIAVNGELEALEAVLETSPDILPAGRRIAVLSYHSLEDRRVKRFLRDGNFEGTVQRDIYGTRIAPFAPVDASPQTASAAEVEKNPRARSARLRIAERRAEDAAGPPVP